MSDKRRQSGGLLPYTLGVATGTSLTWRLFHYVPDKRRQIGGKTKTLAGERGQRAKHVA